MRRISIAAILFTLSAWLSATHEHATANADQPHTLASKLHTQRSSPTDLEITGDIPGVPPGESRYLTRADLLSMSRAMIIPPDDGNFKDPAKVRAISLQELAVALGVAAHKMIVADCRDKYQAHYPHAYLAAHHPVLIAEMNGAALTEAAEDDYGPYMIAHEHFPPASTNPAKRGQPQVPWGVVRIEFRNEKDVYGPISPRGSQGGTPGAKAGYAIARQNCFRCHNSLDQGGMKSGVNWTVLAAMAVNAPDFFAAYVRDPKSKNPSAKMEGSPDLDQPAMAGLLQYFRAFQSATVEGSH